MYAFRGFSNIVLQGYSVGIDDAVFLNVFGGGADCYVPDLLGGGSLNLTCVLAGIIIAAIYAYIKTAPKVISG